MGKWMRKGCFLACFLVCVLFGKMTAAAEEGDAIKNGIFVGEVDLSGMTAQEAVQAVNAYVETLRAVQITLLAAEDREVPVTAEIGRASCRERV